MRLLDRRFSRIAQDVGTARILIPRVREQRAAQARGPAPPVLVHNHGVAGGRPAVRAGYAEGTPSVHRPREERAPDTGPGGVGPRGALAPGKGAEP